jgi:hypothetical protein
LDVLGTIIGGSHRLGYHCFDAFCQGSGEQESQETVEEESE